MSETEHPLILMIDSTNWGLLKRAAAEQGQMVGDYATAALLDDLSSQAVLEAVQPPPGDHTLDGATADALGAIALGRAALKLGITIRVYGGEHHAGKRYGQKEEK